MNINFQTFLLGLLVVSSVTGLVTEAIKKIMAERNKSYYSNTIAGITAVVLALAVGVGYVLITGMAFSVTVIIYVIALMFLSWLCSMVGYDKVIQTLGQLKTTEKDSDK